MSTGRGGGRGVGGGVLEHVDGAEPVARRGEGRPQGRAVEDIGGEPRRRDALGRELRDETVELGGVAGDEGDVEPFGSESSREGEPESGSGADDRDGGHACSPVRGWRRAAAPEVSGASVRGCADGYKRHIEVPETPGSPSGEKPMAGNDEGPGAMLSGPSWGWGG